MRSPILALLVVAPLAVSCGGEDDTSGSDAATDTSDAADAGDTDAVDDADTSNPYACVVPADPPYPDGSAYRGVHANPRNNDYVPCHTATDYTQVWHALEGLAIAQPNTFSPDGATTYVTTTHPDVDGCRVHALDTADGSVRWCRTYPPQIIGSSVEVDADGNLYFTTGPEIVSLTADGEDRWVYTVPLVDDPDRLDGAIGLHFTPDGDVATVTNAGRVVVVGRDGQAVADLDIPSTWGFVPPPAGAELDIRPLLPQAVLDDLDGVFGDTGVEAFFGAFLGSGGNFSDNTLAVAEDGTIYVIGGGADEESGALVQIRWEGGALVPGWYLPTIGGSATSPSVSPDGRWVSIGDGASAAALLNPAASQAAIRIVDIEACDANTDGDADPAVCEAAVVVPLANGSIAGSPPLLDDGIHYLWDLGLSRLHDVGTIDVRALDGDQVLWERDLPDGRVWTAVMTVSEDHIIGTTTRATESNESVLVFNLPGVATSDLTLLDRATGDIAFSAPVTDDAASTVTIGADGSLYVTMLGLVSMLSVDTRPTLGLIRFEPTR